ncbi:hypothetical protein [Actinoplanes sp. M2I2]|uniref:DUF6924 domain-containing protein n=1 Tax=Actinoplanes sp. M2I2 TaxID=1734444 RepID=UPI0020209A16|nr:hypothetical protein [Actinoplanes sp. M2I2]
MRILPGPDERKNFGAVVLRTDYSDEAAWRALREVLHAGNDSDRPPLLVENTLWAGAAVDEVLAAGDGLDVVFLADRAALTDPEHKLLAVTVAGERGAGARARGSRERAFRIVPAWVPVLDESLALGALGFAEFAEAAAQDSEGAFRGFAG